MKRSHKADYVAKGEKMVPCPKVFTISKKKKITNEILANG